MQKVIFIWMFPFLKVNSESVESYFQIQMVLLHTADRWSSLPHQFWCMFLYAFFHFCFFFFFFFELWSKYLCNVSKRGHSLNPGQWMSTHRFLNPYGWKLFPRSGEFDVKYLWTDLPCAILSCVWEYLVSSRRGLCSIKTCTAQFLSKNALWFDTIMFCQIKHNWSSALLFR